MSAPTVPISEASHQLLKELAEQTGQTMMEVLDKALDAYRRKLFFDQLNAGYAELRADPEAWAEHQAERNSWDATLLDGLDPDEHWTEDGRCPTPEEGKPSPAGGSGDRARPSAVRAKVRPGSERRCLYRRGVRAYSGPRKRVLPHF